MAKVNLEEIEKQSLEMKKKEASSGIKEIVGADGKTYYEVVFSGDVFTHKDEATSALSEHLRKEELKKRGLDEWGRTPEQVALSEEKSKLLEKKCELLKAVNEIDVQIGKLNIEDFKVKKDSKKAK